MKLNPIRILSLVLLLALIGCKSKKFNPGEHSGKDNCLFKRYMQNEFNEADSNFDKALLFRTNFCGSELCSQDLYAAMRFFVRNEKKRVLVIVNYNDTALSHIISGHANIRLRFDPTEKYQKYGFQRPGHYAFIFKGQACPAQYINITEKFIQWFVKQ